MDSPQRDLFTGVLGIVVFTAVAVGATQCHAPDVKAPAPSASVRASGATVEYPDCRDTQPPCLRNEAGVLAVITDYTGQREALPVGSEIIRTEVRVTVRWHTVRLP